MNLQDIFSGFHDNEYYKKCIKRRIIKIILGSSVIRVFKKGTKKDVVRTLEGINLDELKFILTSRNYDEWQRKQVNKLYTTLIKMNANLKGLKWGHACKIFNLYISHIIFYSQYFDDLKLINKIKYFIHAPIDSKVLKVLNNTKNFKSLPKSLSLMTEAYYVEIQAEVRMISNKYNCPPFYLDEYVWPN